MIKRIKHSSELPEWFQLKKYDSAKLLDTAGWYEQLEIRKDCFFLLETHDEISKEHSFIQNKIFKIIRRNPIVDATNREILLSQFLPSSNMSSELKSKKINYALGVHSVTARQFANIEKVIIDDKRRYLKSWRNQFDKLLNSVKTIPSKPRLRYRYQAWIDEPLHKSTSCDFKSTDIATINFHLPDNILIEHFKKYLATRRAEIGRITKTYRQPDFSEWIRFGILPYLDLKIWEKEENISIPNRVMADALYPTGESGEETVRKTTAPLAKSLTSDEQLSILGAQAALEIAEHNS